jgi:predicted RecB family endonuclease
VRIRLILLVLSLLAFLSASIGGYLYYSSLREAVFKDAERQAQTRLVMIKKNLSSFLSENIRPVKAMAGMKELPQALAGMESGTARIHLEPERVARHTREFIYDERLSLI